MIRNTLIFSHFFFCFMFWVQAEAQSKISFYDFEIGNHTEVIDKTNLKQIGYENFNGSDIYRFKTPNKNEISITFLNEKLVYIEEDYMYKEHITSSLKNFKFKETKLIDIIERFNSKGFIYTDRNAGEMGDLFYTLICYKIKETNKVLVFGSTLKLDKLKDVKDQKDLWSKLSLAIIILSDEHYLDSIWGSEKEYPKNNNYEVSKFK